MSPVNNAIYLRRRSKVVIHPTREGDALSLRYVASVVKNIEPLGYTFSPRLIEACSGLTLTALTAFYEELAATLQRLRGAHREFKPMYPNFPAQVMEMSESELYINAILHYWTDGRYLPPSEVKERLPLLGNVELTPIDRGDATEFASLFTAIAGMNTSLSEQDKEDLTWFVSAYGDEIGPLLPDAIPQKENMAFLAGLLLKHTTRERAVESVGAFCRTATDVLRLAVALSGGDVSLAKAGKFRNFTRSERGPLLALLDRLPDHNATEDMLRWKGRWIRLGEKLHPGEYQAKYPRAARAFQVLRNDEPFATFNGQVEKALEERDVLTALARLTTRPGDFARRLDHLLRLDTTAEAQGAALTAFAGAAPRVSTPVLLQARHHFATRTNDMALRVFLPKGSVTKAQGVWGQIPELSRAVCDRVVSICEEALTERFATLSPLGRVYVDPRLSDYVLPFALRSASKSLRTLVRGSRLPLPDCTVLRFFVWWKNGTGRTDIDLSAVLFDAQFIYVDVLSYYNLKSFGGVHSGDIVDAPEGACEFIDVTLEKVRKEGARYIVMSLNSYSQQPFVELPECFAGWMVRQKPQRGKVFDARTVQDRLDITGDTRISLPLIIDVEQSKVIWADLALKNQPDWENNVEANQSGIQLMLRAVAELSKPNLHDLLSLHAGARGERVTDPQDADTVFSVENGTPFRLEEIAAQYMG